MTMSVERGEPRNAFRDSETSGAASPLGGVANIAKGPAAAQTDALPWTRVPNYPLDAGGPTDRLYTALGSDFVDIPIFAHFCRQAAAVPDRICVEDGTTGLSYAQALALVSRLAGLVATAVPAGRPVGIFMPSSAHYPLAMLACFACGRVCVPLNMRDPPQRAGDIAYDGRLDAIIGSSSTIADFAAQRALHWIDITEAAASPAAPQVLPPPASVDDPAIILYTSGSTGRPKGIVNNQRSLLQRVAQHANSCHINGDDVLFPLSGPATIAGCRELLAALLTGARLVITDIEALGLRGTWKAFRTHGATITYVVPTLLRALALAAAGERAETLRVVRIGGEKVLWSDIALARELTAPSCAVQIGYSSTETTGAQWFPTDLPAGQETVAPCGHLLPGLAYAVVDEDGLSVAPGEVGELLIRSEHVALGRWEEGALVSGRIAPDDRRCRIHATGDLVSIGTDGLLRVIGRKDRQVKINGKRVEPEELEAMLRRVPGIGEAAVVVSAANELVAAIVPENDGRRPPIGEVWKAIRTALPSALHPTRLHELDALPRLPSGKVDVIALRELDRNRRTARHAPRTEQGRELLEARRLVARTWTGTLGVRLAAGRWDESGGDSLRLLRCVLELEEAIGRELDMDEFTLDMNVETMVRIVARAIGSRDEQPAASPSATTLFLVPGSIGNGPSLAAFGSALGDVAQVATIRYPDLIPTATPHVTIEAMADAALRQISRTQPEGDIRLLGYSLGGAVAFEIAARLLAVGRSVKFLGILDTNVAGTRGSRRESLWRSVQRLRTHRVTFYRMLCRAMARTIVRAGHADRMPTFLRASFWRRAPATQFLLRLESEELLRMRAFGEWVRKSKARLPLKATLFVCNRVGLPHGLGWLPLFDELDIIPVAGGHLDLVVEPHLSVNRPIVARAVAASYA
ncbi:MAG TPA: AMP-binding protein [Xanthobacteraceae bacterium]|nr:AMP-binding protein [Xanthobacteraceae bacterium]